MTPEQRFMNSVKVVSNKCWIWTGNIRSYRYGVFWLNGKRVVAHRLMHEWLVGPIPDKYSVHHICENKLCVNPEHLRAMSESEHYHVHPSRQTQKKKTHCPKGHPYSGDNLVVRQGKKGGEARICRTCRRASWNKYARKDGTGEVER